MVVMAKQTAANSSIAACIPGIRIVPSAQPATSKFKWDSTGLRGGSCYAAARPTITITTGMQPVVAPQPATPAAPFIQPCPRPFVIAASKSAPQQPVTQQKSTHTLQQRSRHDISQRGHHARDSQPDAALTWQQPSLHTAPVTPNLSRQALQPGLAKLLAQQPSRRPQPGTGVQASSCLLDGSRKAGTQQQLPWPQCEWQLGQEQLVSEPNARLRGAAAPVKDHHWLPGMSPSPFAGSGPQAAAAAAAAPPLAAATATRAPVVPGARGEFVWIVGEPAEVQQPAACSSYRLVPPALPAKPVPPVLCCPSVDPVVLALIAHALLARTAQPQQQPPPSSSQSQGLSGSELSWSDRRDSMPLQEDGWQEVAPADQTPAQQLLQQAEHEQLPALLPPSPPPPLQQEQQRPSVSKPPVDASQVPLQHSTEAAESLRHPPQPPTTLPQPSSAFAAVATAGLPVWPPRGSTSTQYAAQPCNGLQAGSSGSGSKRKVSSSQNKMGCTLTPPPALPEVLEPTQPSKPASKLQRLIEKCEAATATAGKGHHKQAGAKRALGEPGGDEDLQGKRAKQVPASLGKIETVARASTLPRLQQPGNSTAGAKASSLPALKAFRVQLVDYAQRIRWRPLAQQATAACCPSTVGLATAARCAGNSLSWVEMEQLQRDTHSLLAALECFQQAQQRAARQAASGGGGDAGGGTMPQGERVHWPLCGLLMQTRELVGRVGQLAAWWGL